MRSHIFTVLLIIVVVIVIFCFEMVFPRNEASAKYYIEAEGYTNVEVTTTRKYCGKNRSVFRFRGVRADGVRVKGRYCFHLLRIGSSISEDQIPSENK